MFPLDVDRVQRGHALNAMCFTLNDEVARTAFARDEDGWCDRYGLDDATRSAVKARDKKALIALGGNMYFVQKLERVKRAGSV